LSFYISKSSSNQKPQYDKSDAAITVDGGYGACNINATGDVYIAVSAPISNKFTGLYDYQLTASIDAPYASYVDETFTRFLDSDGQSALLTTNDTTPPNPSKNISEAWMNRPPVFSIFVQKRASPALIGLQKSICALKRLAPTNVSTEMTLKGGGQPKQRFYVKGLDNSTDYYAITGMVGNGTKNGSIVNGGGTVWKASNFTTQTGLRFSLSIFLSHADPNIRAQLCNRLRFALLRRSCLCRSIKQEQLRGH